MTSASRGVISRTRAGVATMQVGDRARGGAWHLQHLDVSLLVGPRAVDRFLQVLFFSNTLGSGVGVSKTITSHSLVSVLDSNIFRFFGDTKNQFE